MSVYVLPIFSVGRGTRVLTLYLLVGFFWFAPFECNSRRPLNDRPERKDAGCLRPTFAWLGLFSIALSLEYSTCTDNLACKSLANTVGNLTQLFSRIPPVTWNNNSQGRGRRRDTCDHGFFVQDVAEGTKLRRVELESKCDAVQEQSYFVPRK